MALRDEQIIPRREDVFLVDEYRPRCDDSSMAWRDVGIKLGQLAFVGAVLIVAAATFVALRADSRR
jgi:hypothetical protein